MKKDKIRKLRESEKLYRHTHLGREAHKRKNTKYLYTDKGREAARKAQKKYEQSPKGIAKRKEINARAYQKRKAARLAANPRLAKIVQEKQEEKERQENPKTSSVSNFFKK